MLAHASGSTFLRIDDLSTLLESNQIRTKLNQLELESSCTASRFGMDDVDGRRDDRDWGETLLG